MKHSKFFILILLFLLCVFTSYEPVYAAAATATPEFSGNEAINVDRFKEIVENTLSQAGMQGTQAGFKVVDLQTGKTVFDFNGDTLFNPASNMKLVSTAAALNGLSPAYRFTTTIRSSGAPDSQGRIEGNLYIIGHGDPFLTEEIVSRMASDLYATGLREVKGDLLIDDTFFDDIRNITGWPTNRFRHCYEAPNGALSVNFNSAWISVFPAPKAGMRAKIDISPRTTYFNISNNVRTVRKGRTNISIKMSSRRGRNYLNVSGRVNLRDTNGIGACRKIDDPPLFAGMAFIESLKRKGIKINGTVKVRKADDRASYDLLSFRSQPLGELIFHLNKESNNFMAEQTFKTLGAEKKGTPGSSEKGALVTGEFLSQTVGVKNGSYELQNGSGLGKENRLSPDLLIRVLRYMYTNQNCSGAFMASLPIMGIDGTLRNRHRNSMATNRIRAKTGFLNNVMALSGFVETRGCDKLVFSLLLNKQNPRQKIRLKKVQDDIILALSNLVLNPSNGNCSTLTSLK